jgi:hypothetical protein
VQDQADKAVALSEEQFTAKCGEVNLYNRHD